MSHHETTIISGALDLTQKSAKDAMTPISEIFSLDINSKLDMYGLLLLSLFVAFLFCVYHYNQDYLYPWNQ